MSEQQPNISLALPIEAVQIVLAGLGKLPLETSLGVHQHIVGETQRQIQEATAMAQNDLEAAAKAATPKEACHDRAA